MLFLFLGSKEHEWYKIKQIIKLRTDYLDKYHLVQIWFWHQKHVFVCVTNDLKPCFPAFFHNFVCKQHMCYIVGLGFMQLHIFQCKSYLLFAFSICMFLPGQQISMANIQNFFLQWYMYKSAAHIWAYFWKKKKHFANLHLWTWYHMHMATLFKPISNFPTKINLCTPFLILQKIYIFRLKCAILHKLFSFLLFTRKFKGESVAATILLSRMEQSNYTSRFFHIYARQQTWALPFPRKLNHVHILVITWWIKWWWLCTHITPNDCAKSKGTITHFHVTVGDRLTGFSCEPGPKSSKILDQLFCVYTQFILQ